MIQADNSNNNGQNLSCLNEIYQVGHQYYYSFMAVLGPTFVKYFRYAIALVTCNTFYKYI